MLGATFGRGGLDPEQVHVEPQLIPQPVDVATPPSDMRCVVRNVGAVGETSAVRAAAAASV